MKKIFVKTVLTGVVALALPVSCDLDINDNPNSATAAVVTPDLTLPVAIARTVYNQVYYYGYLNSAYLVGYQVPGDGVSGFGDVYTYNFTASASDENGWAQVFAYLRDFNTIIKTSEADPRYALYGGIAHILKAYSYQLLVDAYGDVPYTEGLQGAEGNVSPAFDKDAEVYKALVAELDEAIAILKASKDNVGGGVLGLNANSDPVFSGDYAKWIQFANNIKLRLLVRARGTSIDAFVQSAFGDFSAEGFLKEDVLVNPGYNASAQQNPYWTVYHSSIAGNITQPARFFIPSVYTLSFYDGKKLSDDKRGALVYQGWPSVPASQLGDEANRPKTPSYIWFIGTGTGTGASDAAGILKSRSAPAPLFFAFETHFLLAEAALYGFSPDGNSDVKTHFENGVKASFDFLERYGAGNSLPSGANPTADAATYITANSGNYFADFDAAVTTEQKLEAIITQKYIASNILNSNEAWNEFRRTGYPAISGSGAEGTFVSIQSQSSRADKLPVRLIYPQSEYNLNANTPKILNAYSNPVFWDQD
jgi:hypothetical protein